MKLKIVRKTMPDGITSLKLSGEINIYSIKKVKEFLLAEMMKTRGILLDCSDVDDADTSAFQLFIFLRNEAGRSRKQFSITELKGRLKSMSDLYRESF